MMPPIRISAFDLSLTATGYATIDGAISARAHSGVLTPPKAVGRGIARLRWIRQEVLMRCAGADLVVLEGYSFGAKGNAILNLAELGGVIRVALADREQLYVDIPPASLKLFATGKGNAPKDQVLAEAIKRLDYDGHDHNEADALWLLRMMVAFTGHQTTNEHQRRALAKVNAPTFYTTATPNRDTVAASTV